MKSPIDKYVDKQEVATLRLNTCAPAEKILEILKGAGFEIANNGVGMNFTVLADNGHK